MLDEKFDHAELLYEFLKNEKFNIEKLEYDVYIGKIDDEQASRVIQRYLNRPGVEDRFDNFILSKIHNQIEETEHSLKNMENIFNKFSKLFEIAANEKNNILNHACLIECMGKVFLDISKTEDGRMIKSKLRISTDTLDLTSLSNDSLDNIEYALKSII